MFSHHDCPGVKGLMHPIWTNVSPLASHNISTAVGSPVVVAVLYTVSMPKPRVPYPPTANLNEMIVPLREGPPFFLV